MAFAKLDTRILDSTLWLGGVEMKLVFITALLMAKPQEILEPIPEIGDDGPTGYMVPAGWYGLVPSSGPGIVARAGLGFAMDKGLEALDQLGAPEKRSFSQEFAGRRLIRTALGYIVLNFMKYRDVDHTAGERMKRYRERNRYASNATAPVKTRNVTPSEGRGQIPEAEEKEIPPSRGEVNSAPEPEETLGVTAGEPKRFTPRPGDLAKVWNENRGKLPEVRLPISSGRERHAKARLEACPDLDRWAQAVRRMAASAFCTGSNDRGWIATLDFLLRPDTLARVEEGKYDDRTPTPPGKRMPVVGQGEWTPDEAQAEAIRVLRGEA